MTVAGGWMARAASFLENEDECAGHGWLVLDRAPFADDAGERERLATAALAIARRFGDVDLEFDALSLLGESHVAAGRVPEGNEAARRGDDGRLRRRGRRGGPRRRHLLSVSERVRDRARRPRAEQWLAVAGAFGAWSDFVSPVCRTHYGGLLIAVGRWAEAEEQLLGAARAFEEGYRGLSGWPLARLGDLRARQGRFEEARRLIDGHESHPIARRTLAAIALGRGELVLADELARLCLEGELHGEPGCAPVLEMLVQIRVARQDVPAAHAALDELTTIAASSADDAVLAYAELAEGRVRAATSESSAPGHLQAASAALHRSQAPARGSSRAARARPGARG